MVGPDARVRLVIPASPDYLRLVRLTCADAGSRAGLDVEEIDDLRIAVSELCHLLMGQVGPGDVVLEIAVTPAGGGVVVDGHASRPGTVEISEISRRILDTVADEHSVRDDDDGRRFHLVKRRRSA